MLKKLLKMFIFNLLKLSKMALVAITVLKKTD